jgi:hypothetical protein
MFDQTFLNHETDDYLPDKAIPNLPVVLPVSKTFLEKISLVTYQVGNGFCSIIHCVLSHILKENSQYNEPYI